MSTPRPRPAPVTNQTFLSFMLLHILLLGSCRSARSICHMWGSPRLCVHDTTAGARNQPAGAEVRSTSARGAILSRRPGVGRHLTALRRCRSLPFDAVSSAGNQGATHYEIVQRLMVVDGWCRLGRR